MLSPILLVVGIVCLLAKTNNYNIPTDDPYLRDIRVRRDVNVRYNAIGKSLILKPIFKNDYQNVITKRQVSYNDYIYNNNGNVNSSYYSNGYNTPLYNQSYSKINNTNVHSNITRFNYFQNNYPNQVDHKQTLDNIYNNMPMYNYSQNYDNLNIYNNYYPYNRNYNNNNVYDKNNNTAYLNIHYTYNYGTNNAKYNPNYNNTVNSNHTETNVKYNNTGIHYNPFNTTLYNNYWSRNLYNTTFYTTPKPVHSNYYEYLLRFNNSTKYNIPTLQDNAYNKTSIPASYYGPNVYSNNGYNTTNYYYNSYQTSQHGFPNSSSTQIHPNQASPYYVASKNYTTLYNNGYDSYKPILASYNVSNLIQNPYSAYNRSVIKNNNSNSNIAYNSSYNAYNNNNNSVITTTPIISRGCIIGCYEIACPAFFKKLGFLCVPDVEDY